MPGIGRRNPRRSDPASGKSCATRILVIPRIKHPGFSNAVLLQLSYATVSNFLRNSAFTTRIKVVKFTCLFWCCQTAKVVEILAAKNVEILTASSCSSKRPFWSKCAKAQSGQQLQVSACGDDARCSRKPTPVNFSTVPTAWLQKVKFEEEFAFQDTKSPLN